MAVLMRFMKVAKEVKKYTAVPIVSVPDELPTHSASKPHRSVPSRLGCGWATSGIRRSPEISGRSPLT